METDANENPIPDQVSSSHDRTSVDTTDWGAASAAEPDSYELGLAVLDDRLQKNYALQVFFGNDSMPQRERVIEFDKMLGAQEDRLSLISGYTEEIITESLDEINNMILFDINTYTKSKELFERIKISSTEEEKDIAVNDLYYYLSFKIKRCIADESRKGTASNNDLREHIFYKMIIDIACKSRSKKYEQLTLYTKMTPGMYEVDVRRIHTDLYKSSVQIWLNLNFNPILNNEPQTKINALKAKIEVVKTTREGIIQRKRELSSRIDEFAPNEEALAQLRAEQITPQDLDEQRILDYYNCAGPLLVQIMQDAAKIEDDVRALTTDLNEWIMSNQPTIGTGYGKLKKSIIDFTAAQMPTTLAAAPVQPKATAKKKKKAASPPAIKSVASEFAPLPAPAHAPIAPVSYARPLLPVEVRTPRLAPKIKTVGVPDPDRLEPAAAAHEEEEEIDFLFSERSEYPEVINHLITSNHPDISIYKDVFIELAKHGIKGNCLWQGDKHHGFTLNHADGTVKAETFFHPLHKGSDERSWPSWRIALHDLLVDFHIINEMRIGRLYSGEHHSLHKIPNLFGKT